MAKLSEIRTTETVTAETVRYNDLPKVIKVIFVLLSNVGLAIAILYIFGLSIAGYALLDNAYYYLLIAFFSSCAFLILPARKQDRRIPWYDIAAAAVTFGTCIYFFLHAEDILLVGWSHPTPFNFALGLILCILILEGGRRMAGNFYLGVCAILGLYPVFAGHMPGFLSGRSFSLINTVGFHVFGSEGLIGLPPR